MDTLSTSNVKFGMPTSPRPAVSRRISQSLEDPIGSTSSSRRILDRNTTIKHEGARGSSWSWADTPEEKQGNRDLLARWGTDEVVRPRRKVKPDKQKVEPDKLKAIFEEEGADFTPSESEETGSQASLGSFSDELSEGGTRRVSRKRKRATGATAKQKHRKRVRTEAATTKLKHKKKAKPSAMFQELERLARTAKLASPLRESKSPEFIAPQTFSLPQPRKMAIARRVPNEAEKARDRALKAVIFHEDENPEFVKKAKLYLSQPSKELAASLLKPQIPESENASSLLLNQSPASGKASPFREQGLTLPENSSIPNELPQTPPQRLTKSPVLPNTSPKSPLQRSTTVPNIPEAVLETTEQAQTPTVLRSPFQAPKESSLPPVSKSPVDTGTPEAPQSSTEVPLSAAARQKKKRDETRARMRKRVENRNAPQSQLPQTASSSTAVMALANRLSPAAGQQSKSPVLASHPGRESSIPALNIGTTSNKVTSTPVHSDVPKVFHDIGVQTKTPTGSPKRRREGSVPLNVTASPRLSTPVLGLNSLNAPVSQAMDAAELNASPARMQEVVMHELPNLQVAPMEIVHMPFQAQSYQAPNTPQGRDEVTKNLLNAIGFRHALNKQLDDAPYLQDSPHFQPFKTAWNAQGPIIQAHHAYLDQILRDNPTFLPPYVKYDDSQMLQNRLTREASPTEREHNAVRYLLNPPQRR